jgi:hypothetical protein
MESHDLKVGYQMKKSNNRFHGRKLFKYVILVVGIYIHEHGVQNVDTSFVLSARQSW